MITVLIVDDERLVRIGVRSSLQWEDHNFKVIGEACNGEEALQKIHALKPDLVLTDIRMPKMDGIELLKEIEKQKLPVETVIMSCYDEFELVRSALRHGAADYILKLSASDEEIMEVLERTRQKILNRRRALQKDSEWKEADLREKFALLLRDPSASITDLSMLAQQLKLPLDIHNMALILFSIDPVFDSVSLSYRLPDKKATALLCSMLHDELSRQAFGDCFLLDEGKRLFLLCLAPDQQPDAIAENTQQIAASYFNLTLSMAILNYDFCRVHQFTALRRTAELLTEKKFILGRGCIFPVRDLGLFSKEFSLSATDLLKDVKGLADIGKLADLIPPLCETMRTQHSSRNSCLAVFTEIFYKVAGLLRTYGGSIDDLNQKAGFNLSVSLQNLIFLEDVPTWFHSFHILLNDYAAACAENWKRDEILSAIRYINENYNLPISAQKVARVVGISEAYFSTLFKKETGIGFSEYLTDLRIQKAKSLLEDKSIYIYEVCEYVGYSDANYFGKVFKKHTGMSPETYRRIRQAQT